MEHQCVQGPGILKAVLFGYRLFFSEKGAREIIRRIIL
jgi:hypothetical protein